MDFKTKQKEEEYQSQFFGFTSSSVTDAVKETLEYEITSSATAMKNCILANCQKDEDIMHTNQLTDSIINNYKSNIIEETDKMKDKMDNILKIPPHIVLAGDEDQTKQFTAEELNVDAELKELERRLNRALYMEVLLKSELNQIDVNELEENMKEMKLRQSLIDENIEFIDEIKKYVL